MDAAAWRERLRPGPKLGGWSPLEWALLDAMLTRPGIALPLHVLMDAMWTARGLEAPETAEVAIRVYVGRVRRGLNDMGLNPDAVVNDPPYAYGVNLDVLPTRPVRRPRYIISLAC